MCNSNESTNNCIHEILKTILVLQKQANMPECCLDTCDKNFLGGTAFIMFLAFIFKIKYGN